ncbi:MAG: MFS transporter [Thermoplasmatota archaeon]
MDSSPRGRAYVRLLSAVYSATFVVRVAFGIVTVTFAKYVAVSNAIYGLIVAANPLLELATVIVVGPIVDRRGGRSVLLFGLAVAGIATLGMAATRDPIVLGGMNALIGVAAGSVLVPTLAIVAQVAPDQHRGREMGLFDFVNLFGWIAGFGAGFAMLQAFQGDLPLSFIVAAALAMGGLFWAALSIHGDWHGRPGEEEVHIRTFLTLLRNRQILLLTAPWLLAFMFVASLITFQSRAVPVSSGAEIAILMIGLGGVLVGAEVWYGKLSDRYGRNPLMLIGACGFAALLLLVAYASHVAGTAGALDWLLGVWPLVGLLALLALAFPPAALAALADVAQTLPKGMTMSIYSFSIAAGFTLGPVITGIAADVAGLNGVLAFFIALSGGLLLLVLARFRSGGPGRPSAAASESAGANTASEPSPGGPARQK